MSSPNLAFPLSMVSFPDVNLQMPELEGDDPRALAQALRQWQDENWKEDLALSMAPGIGQAYGAADLAASNELEEPAWMQALYAAGMIPAIGPFSRKAAQLLGSLPQGGVRKWLETVANIPEFAGDDSHYKAIVDMFSPDGNFTTYHGSTGHMDTASTKYLDNLVGEGEGMRVYGPGLYTASDLETPSAYGQTYTQGHPISTIYELDVPNESVGGYIHGGMSNVLPDFNDQTEQVKDILRSMYPNASDEEAMRLISKSPLMQDIFHEADSLAPFTDRAELGNELAALKKGRELGLKGNFHKVNKNTPLQRNFVHYDPDDLILSNTYAASPSELSDAIRMNTEYLRINDRANPIYNSRQALEDLFGYGRRAEMPIPGMDSVHTTPEVLETFLRRMEKARANPRWPE